MKERFEGAGTALADALARQEFAAGDRNIVSALISRGVLMEFPPGAKIITQDGHDNDIYLLIAGSTAILVKGNQIALRTAGQHVGEMAAIEPSQRRAADVVAHDTVVAWKISSADFNEIGRTYPQIWLPIARALSRRLYQRNEQIPQPNDAPNLFIISSSEALAVANVLQRQLRPDVLATVWTDGVFFAGGYPLEALENAVGASDFAVAIAQPDDIIETRGGRHPTLRDNVLFELGLFMGKLSRFRAILIHPKIDGLKLPSDFHGLTVLSYPPGPDADLAARLTPACNDIKKLVAKYGVLKLIGL